MSDVPADKRLFGSLVAMEPKKAARLGRAASQSSAVNSAGVWYGTTACDGPVDPLLHVRGACVSCTMRLDQLLRRPKRGCPKSDGSMTHVHASR